MEQKLTGSLPQRVFQESSHSWFTVIQVSKFTDNSLVPIAQDYLQLVYRG